MHEARLPEERIRIPVIPPIAKKLEQVRHPDEIDAVTNAEAPASLLNIYLATPADLSPIGLGQALYIPVQISGRDGGRKSLYYLDEQEETLMGAYTTSQGIALRYMRRLTGQSKPAQTGDTYALRITNRDGEAIYEDDGVLEITDPTTTGIVHCPKTGTFHPKGDKLGVGLVIREFILGQCFICSALR